MLIEAVFRLIVNKAFDLNLTFEFSNRPENHLNNTAGTITFYKEKRMALSFYVQNNTIRYIENWQDFGLDINDPDKIDSLLKGLNDF